MYLCALCGETFDEPVRGVVQEYPVPFEDRWEKRYGDVCPFCESPSIEEAFVCEKCRKTFPVDLKCVDGDICRECDSKQLDPIFENILKGAFK